MNWKAGRPEPFPAWISTIDKAIWTMSVISLTTDFGTADSFVGVMKGVILGIAPDAALVDVTHEIAPQNVRQAVYVVSNSFSFFPRGTIHLCVVDPGVGSERRPIALEAAGHYFVGPDNGVFTEIIHRFHPGKAREIINPEMTLPVVSDTFHGRDVFAPAAAWIARGAPLSSLGPIVEKPVTIDLPSQILSAPNMIEGEVIYIDRFGNAITNLSRRMWRKVYDDVGAEGVEIQVRDQIVSDVLPCYSAAKDDEKLSAVFGSWDTLELFARNGSAEKLFGLSVGDRVEARFY